MENLKEVLEILYYISNIILVIIAYFALAQVKIARAQVLEQRKASLINAKRDSLRATSEQIAKYGSEIVPLQDILDEKIRLNSIKYFTDSKVTITNNEIKIEPCSDKNEFKKLYLIASEFLNVMNAMEGFAIYFVSGVADEKTAYWSLSSTYCRTIKMLLPYILIATNKENSFKATIKLFLIWNARMESYDLENQKLEIERKIQNNNIQSIKIIGDDDLS